MPKRMVDGEGIWESDKIRKLDDKHKPEYAYLLPLAEANGVFEVNAYKIWARVYAYNRRTVTPDFVCDILLDFARVGLLKAWEEEGKIWGFWDGSEKPGRLPGSTEIRKYKNLPPDPPLTCSQDETIKLLEDNLRVSLTE